MAEKEGEEQTIATDLVVTKYKMAAEIVNGVFWGKLRVEHMWEKIGKVLLSIFEDVRV